MQIYKKGFGKKAFVDSKNRGNQIDEENPSKK